MEQSEMVDAVFGVPNKKKQKNNKNQKVVTQHAKSSADTKYRWPPWSLKAFHFLLWKDAPLTMYQLQ